MSKRFTKYEAQYLAAVTCDWCGSTSTDRWDWPDTRQEEDSSYRFTRSGCTIATEDKHSGRWEEMGGNSTTRSIDLCPDCTAKVLDWIVSQGGAVTERAGEW